MESFFPNLLKLNKKAILFLTRINNKNSKKTINKIANRKDELLKFKFLYKGDSDPYFNLFFKKVYEEFQLVNKKAVEFYTQKQEYAQLYIYNDFCNLKCPYCVRNYKNKKLQTNISLKKRILILNSIIDQYIKRKIINGAKKITISFNGGEILLEWDLIKFIVKRNSEKYRHLKFKYYINTNMTLMNKKIAKFISKHDFDLDISIDGYKEAHNKTRIYHDGKGSFDDVIKGLEIYRKYNKKNPIIDFQGTIENPDDFIPEEVFKMRHFGFEKARLGSNLLNVSEEDAIKKSRLMKMLLELNLKNTFQVSDLYFNNIRHLINLEEYKFYFTCNGLSCLPKMGIYVNISSMRFSHICSYVPKATVAAESLNYDIYNPKLWEISRNFIKDRMNSLKNNCSKCDLIGICKGDCVMLGLDNENQLNKSACIFQNEMWKLFLNHVYMNKLKKNNDN